MDKIKDFISKIIKQYKNLNCIQQKRFLSAVFLLIIILPLAGYSLINNKDSIIKDKTIDDGTEIEPTRENAPEKPLTDEEILKEYTKPSKESLNNFKNNNDIEISNEQYNGNDYTITLKNISNKKIKTLAINLKSSENRHVTTVRIPLAKELGNGDSYDLKTIIPNNNSIKIYKYDYSYLNEDNNIVYISIDLENKTAEISDTGKNLEIE